MPQKPEHPVSTRLARWAPDSGPTRPALGWRRAFLFASGDFACNLYWQSVALYLLFYYTDVAGIAPEVAGLIYLAGSVWDGIAGLAVGLLADRRQQTGPGLQRYLLFGTLPVGLSFLLLYAPLPVHGGALIAVSLTGQLLFRTLYAAVNVPYAALSVEVARTSSDRARIAGLRMIFGAAAAALVAAGTQAIALRVSGRPDGAAGFLAAAAIFAALAVPILFNVGLRMGVPSRSPSMLPAPRIGATLRSIGRNRAFLTLNLAMFGAVIAITMVTKATLYYFKYWVGNEAAAGEALALMGMAGVLFVPPWMAVSARWGPRSQWFSSIGIGAAALVAFALVPDADAAGTRIFLIAFQAAITGFSFGFWAMLPDTVDYGEQASGVRVQVLLFGLASLLQKIAIGLAAALIGLVLGLSGYVPDARQPAETMTSLKMAMTLVPLAGLGLSAVAMALNPMRPFRLQAE